MGLEQKLMLIDAVQQKLADQMTMADVNKAVEALKSVLDGFEVFQKSGETNPENDDMLKAYVAALRNNMIRNVRMGLPLCM